MQEDVDRWSQGSAINQPDLAQCRGTANTVHKHRYETTAQKGRLAIVRFHSLWSCSEAVRYITPYP